MGLWVNWALVIVGIVCVIAELVMGAMTGFDLALIGGSLAIGGGIGLFAGSEKIGLLAAGVLALVYFAVLRNWLKAKATVKHHPSNVDALIGKIQPATRIANADQPDGMFKTVVNYLVEQNKFVEPLYEMEKNGQLTGEDEKGMQGRPFLEGQLVKAGQMLGDIWLTAWLDAPEDTYLEKQLQQRNTANPQSN